MALLTVINAALEGLKFDPDEDFNGEVTLTITTVDKGNTGEGDEKQDTDTIKITVEPLNDAPEIVIQNSTPTTENREW